MRRVTYLFSLLAAIGILFTGCVPTAPTSAGSSAETEAASEAADTPKAGGTLTVGLNGEIDTIDPHVSVTIVGGQVSEQIFEGLVRLNKTLDDVVPMLAESWEQ